MGTERRNYECDYGNGGKIQISGAKWFYGDSNVQDATGWSDVDDGQTGTNEENSVHVGQAAKDRLVLLVAVLKGDGIGQNASQNDKSRRFEFYCDPSRAEDAMLKLPKKDVDRGAGLGSYKIQRVYRKRVISRR
jgi:hypothetical protein